MSIQSKIVCYMSGASSKTYPLVFFMLLNLNQPGLLGFHISFMNSYLSTLHSNCLVLPMNALNLDFLPVYTYNPLL